MSNLIITIIAIALGAAVVLASIYSGGTALNQGSARSNATAVLNQAQQISGAAAIYSNENAGVAVLTADLSGALVTGNFLKSLPVPPTALNTNAGTRAWTVSGINLVTPATSLEVCTAVERQRNATATAPALVAAVPNNAYGCWEDSAAPGTYQVYFQL